MYRTDFGTLGKGEGGMFWENSTETSILSSVKQITVVQQKPTQYRKAIFYQLKKKIKTRTKSILHKIFQKSEEKVTLPKSFYEASITLILKLKTLHENYRLISLMKTSSKNLNKIPWNRIQQYPVYCLNTRIQVNPQNGEKCLQIMYLISD